MEGNVLYRYGKGTITKHIKEGGGGRDFERRGGLLNPEITKDIVEYARRSPISASENVSNA